MDPARFAALAAVILLAPASANAQSVTLLDCRPRVGLNLGAASNGDVNGAFGDYPRNRSGHSADVAAMAELPLGDRVSVRADVGTAAWIFQDRDPWGVPLLRDRVRVTRATLAALKQTRTPCGAPVRLYVGAGIGLYRYHLREQRASTTRAGYHLLLGMEVAPRERVAFAFDVSLHAARGPGWTPVHSYMLFIAQASAGVRLVF